MKALLIDPFGIHQQNLHSITCVFDEITIVNSNQINAQQSEASEIDVILALGDFSNPMALVDPLLFWRTNPNSYLIPCWVADKAKSFEQVCLWPRLAIDCFGEPMDTQGMCDWLNAVTEWQQHRMHLSASNSLRKQSMLELIASLALHKATGELSIFDEEGNEGRFSVSGGNLTSASAKHLSDSEAFFECFSWSQGSYCWEPTKHRESSMEPHPLQQLLEKGLRLLRDANLLFRFLPDLQHAIQKTGSESALDDRAIPFFESHRAIYDLIDGNYSAAEIIQASPLSAPRTMGALARWFSLDDIRVATVKQAATASCRLLIVDDSNFMCKALQNIFLQDPRLEVVGIANDGHQALELIPQRKPDVITLDLQMPRMDGLTTLKHIMIRDPKPVVILSAFTKETSQLTYESFKYGAVDVISKPSNGVPSFMTKETRELQERVVQASCVRMEAARYIRQRTKNGNTNRKGQQSLLNSLGRPQPVPGSSASIVLIICGKGGFPALLRVLFSLSTATPLPPIVACMAMSRKAMEAMAPNLANDCAIPVTELVADTLLQPGTCYLCSYEDHYRLMHNESEIRASVDPTYDGAPHPFDAMLSNIAASFGDQAVALCISGTDSDGVVGMQSIYQAGGQCFVLAPDICLQPELPRKILDLGCARMVSSAVEIGSLLEGHPPPALISSRLVRMAANDHR